MDYKKIYDIFEKSQKKLIHGLVAKTRECYLLDVKNKLYETFLTTDQKKSVEKYINELEKHLKGRYE